MSERDDLVLLFERIDPVASPATYDDFAREVLDAGYRKPRIVTTVEELDSLPIDSVVFLTQQRPESTWGPYRDVFRKGPSAWIGINGRFGESPYSLIGYGGELLLIYVPEES